MVQPGMNNHSLMLETNCRPCFTLAMQHRLSGTPTGLKPSEWR